MKGYWARVWSNFKRNRLALAGLIIVAFLFLIAILAPLIANNKPYIYITKEKKKKVDAYTPKHNLSSFFSGAC